MIIRKILCKPVKPSIVLRKDPRNATVYIVHAGADGKTPAMHVYAGVVESTVLGEIWTGKVCTWIVGEPGRIWMSDDSIPLESLSTTPDEAISKWRAGLQDEHRRLTQRLHEIDLLLACEGDIKIP